MIRSSDPYGPGFTKGSFGGSSSAAVQPKSPSQKQPIQGSLLSDATDVSVDIRHPIDLLRLNEAIEVTKMLIDASYPWVKEGFGRKPLMHPKSARKQFLAVAKNKRHCINKIRKAIN